MKTENSLELKARFFALYYNQFVMKIPNNDDKLRVFDEWILKVVKNDSYLELTPLSQISDEDAIEVAKILFGDDISESELKVWLPKISANLRNQFGSNIFPIMQPYFSISWQVADYLRSKGYALPFLNISVNKQIELGWIKLKEEK
jgi:hypothetical protein